MEPPRPLRSVTAEGPACVVGDELVRASSRHPPPARHTVGRPFADEARHIGVGVPTDRNCARARSSWPVRAVPGPARGFATVVGTEVDSALSVVGLTERMKTNMLRNAWTTLRDEW